MERKGKRLVRTENRVKRITFALTETQLNAVYDAAERSKSHSIASFIRKSLGFAE